MAREYTGSATYEVTAKLFERPCRVNERTIDLAGEPTEIADNNPRRLLLHIVNMGGYNVRVGFSRELLWYGSTVLAANGGAMTLNVAEDGELVGYATYALYPVGLGRIYVLEMIAQ